MWIQNRIKIVCSVVALFIIMLTASSCVSKFSNEYIFFESEDSVDYDYLVIEISNTSYIWIDNNTDIASYGEWIYSGGVKPLVFTVDMRSADMMLSFLDGDYINGEVYESDISVQELHRCVGDLFLRLDIDEISNDRTAICSYSEYDAENCEPEMLCIENETMIMRKLSIYEWQQWMRERSLDPNLYIL